MMYYCAVVTCCLFGSVLSSGSFFSRDQMARTPTPMKGFDTTRATGKWYITYAMNPDSWRGADEFTDWYQYFTINQNMVSSVDVWRKPGVSTECSRTPFVLSSGEAVYLLDHSTGGATSGKAVVVAADYNSYLIVWGCTKPSVHPGICHEFYFQVKTRSPYPSQTTHRKIDTILRQLWGVTTTDIVRIKQGNPCHFSSEPDYKGFGVPGHYSGPRGGPEVGYYREPGQGPIRPPLHPSRMRKYWRYQI